MIVNTGQAHHDWTLGDQAAQDEHAREMAGMHGMAHEAPNLVDLPAGTTAHLTWRFTTPGELLYGCHQPGHYAAGMVGRITVTP